MPNDPRTLIISHLGGQQFTVHRQEDGKRSSPVHLTAPDEVVVAGRPDSHLANDLRWYLERFLDYPFPPHTELADRIQSALVQWGQSTFQQLFNGQPLLWYDRIRSTGLEHLVLKIASDDPRILAWPWEALCDLHGTTLAHTCRLERQLRELSDPQPLPPGLSSTRINILMVIARPFGDKDVGFHAVSGPLVEWVRREKVPVRIDVLRPPTFPALQQRLEARPGYYHIVHFDGHGGYGEATAPSSPYEFGTPEGHLLFEDHDGSAFAVSAKKLTALLTEHRIPIMVLNACRSAGIDARAADPFASTAAALLKAGVRGVVAMAYNLYVRGAQQFVPAFYRRLLKSGDIAEATRDGRKAMLLNDARACPRGEYPLQDWLVPVLYVQEVVRLPVQSATEPEARLSQFPAEAQAFDEYGFIGRQDAIHQLERALQRQPAAAILIHGIAGIGKTTLARGFLQWLEQTGGLPATAADPASTTPFAGTLWLMFDDIRSAEYVINHLLLAVGCGTRTISLPLEQKLSIMIQTLHRQPWLIVWDNFESAAGINGTEVTPLLTEVDRMLLKRVLKDLRNGRTRILITSRSPEDWLAPTEVFRVPLRGLRGEDAWAYCNAVVRDLGLRLDRSDAHSQQLLKELDGHPLALRSILLQLADTPADQLLQRLKQAFAGQLGDESTGRIFAVLELLNQGFPAAYAPILQLIGLHQRYVDLGFVGNMLGVSEKDPGGQRLISCFDALERAGLIHHLGNDLYSMHPALQGFLATAHPPEQALADEFMQLMAAMADSLTPKPFHEQRGPFAIHGANIQRALVLATATNHAGSVAALIQALGSFAFRSRDFTTATRLFEQLASGNLNEESEAISYHQLGLLAHERGDFATAEHCYQKSCILNKKLGNDSRLAVTYHQLGWLAQDRRDFLTAERWYLKAVAIKEKFADEANAAHTYHHLGMIAQEQGDFPAAEAWYKKSLAIEEKLGDEHGAALTHHHLGLLAHHQCDLPTAERWYLKSLVITEKFADEPSAANAYHLLGMLAQDQQEFSTAERWYLKSLAIREKLGNEDGAASTYHQLGMTAGDQHDFPTAERWFLKALAIKEKLRNEHGVAMTYGALGRHYLAQEDFKSAGECFLQSLRGFATTKDGGYFQVSLRNFIRCLRSADPAIQATLRGRWKDTEFEQVASLARAEQNFKE